MDKLDLGGKWALRGLESGELTEGALPGCNYLDLVAAGKLDDPFWGTNEEQARQIAGKVYEYSRLFDVPAVMLEHDQLNLVVSGLDTLAVISLNGQKVAETDNAHRTWRFPIKAYLNEKNNDLRILFKSPLPYMKEKSEQIPLPGMGMGIKGVQHIRKPQCHFGWDWGPSLPPAGISGNIGIEAFNTARLGDVRIHQDHKPGYVDLTVQITPILFKSEGQGNLAAVCKVTGPDGGFYENRLELKESLSSCALRIDDPKLWWSNGLGGQPLYSVQVTLLDRENVLDIWNRQIGLRTLELDTSPDRWGRQFQFRINGVPIFAKGADWIPSDSFVTRTSGDDLDFYIRSAKEANMNMLRVWGGGYYESDLFYDLCDKYGILVWQDFGFACMPYLFSDPNFLESVRQEVMDNVARVRHHTSIALWCGNNEIDVMSMLWKRKKTLYKDIRNFFYRTLAELVAELDPDTPYWPGSPCSGSMDVKPNDLNSGDTHLWQVWHGMMPIESFRRFPTRFCSEFGMESLPSMRTVRTFTDDPGISLFKPVMAAHQKSGGGNEKMLFYLLSKYRNPADFEDFIYLSQLIQSETVRCATEQWRRNFGRCNGALYWQYNDCWPVASWAGIDYGKQFKAVQYRAKHFNSMVMVSADLYPRKADIYVINDLPSKFTGAVRWELTDFNGKIVSSGEEKADIDATRAEKIMTLDYNTILTGNKRNEVVLALCLTDQGNIVSKQTCLLVPDKEAALKHPTVNASVEVKGKTAYLTLCSDVFARYVYVELDGILTPLSENYFDIEGGKTYTITFDIPDGMDVDSIKRSIRIKSLADVNYKGSLLNDKFTRLAMLLRKQNLISWILFKFI